MRGYELKDGNPQAWLARLLRRIAGSRPPGCMSFFPGTGSAPTIKPLPP
jgi:hypothetical protein